ncbi:MAG: recombinase zinc beta ribbon domain-containing protein, partial [Firmicutes bacterium]|nr:recombinase zinc beta ribbon domain-containing protein [Bacillota bacterium]
KREKGTRYSGVSIFSNKIKCADCGGWFGSKVWHSTDKYRRVIYRCNSKYNGEKCETPHLTEEEIKVLFVNTYNKLLTEKKEIIANVELMRKTLFNTDELEAERHKLQEEMKILVDMTHNIVAENARITQNQDEYQKRYDGLVQRYEKAKSQYDEVVYRIEQKETQSEKMRLFIKTLKEQDGIITDFDETLWSSTVAFVTVGKKERSITFKDGTEIRI